MKIWLKPLSFLDGDLEWQLLQDMGPGENGFTNDGYGISREEFPDYLRRHVHIANSIDLGEGYVPQSVYWVMLEDRPVGVGKIRHRLNAHLLAHGGNIGYGLLADVRGQGIGREMLRLLLDRAWMKGLDSVLITCSPRNLPSRRVIEANGGQLEKENEEVCWFWVNR